MAAAAPWGTGLNGLLVLSLAFLFFVMVCISVWETHWTDHNRGMAVSVPVDAGRFLGSRANPLARGGNAGAATPKRSGGRVTPTAAALLTPSWPHGKYNKWAPDPTLSSDCPAHPGVSAATRQLLRSNFRDVLASTNFTGEGFVRQFIHARPFRHTEYFEWIIWRGKFQRNTARDPDRVLSDARPNSLAAVLKLIKDQQQVCSGACPVATAASGSATCRAGGDGNSRQCESAGVAPFACRNSKAVVCPHTAKRARALVIAQSDEHNSGWDVAKDSDFRKKCCGIKKRRGGLWAKLGCFCQKEERENPALLRQIVETRYFATIAYEAMDVPMEGVRPSPIPLTETYSLAEDGRVAASLLKVASEATLKGKSGVLAAWGAAWPKLDNMVQSRIAASKWIDSTSLVNRTLIPRQDYHRVLGQHKFAMSPTGGGIQSPKVWEAILVLTIPIVQRPQAAAYAALREAGYPLAVVDEWSEITEERLKQWWEELSPHLARARYMFLTDVWMAYVTHPCPILNIENFIETLANRKV